MRALAGPTLSAVAVTLCLVASACIPDAAPPLEAAPDAGSTGPAKGLPEVPDPDPSDAVFEPGHMLEVAVDMDPKDWDSLRHQYREVSKLLGKGCMDGPKKSPYTQFRAKVTVDGKLLEDSAVRKKGFLGSASISKPSLKLSFDEFVPGREYKGLTGMTLNNSNQDLSVIKTCLAFKIFRDAGLPASRCNLARLTVNGKFLGLYAHVEPVGKRLLRRHFPDASGNLYEGQLSDFRRGWTATYEKKENEDDADRRDLDAVSDALLAGDEELDAELGKVLDIDAFMTYWAMESLLAAWDGYAGNTNNHFVYHEPKSGKMYFLPWSPDMSFDAVDPLSAPDRPQSVSAKGAIARRLYATPRLRARYAAKMTELLNKSWKEDAILAEINRMEAMIAPHLGESAAAAKMATAAIRAFVSGRRAVLEAELKPTPPEWKYPPRDTACGEIVGTVKGSFVTTWGSAAKMNPFMTGTGSFDLAIPKDKPQSSLAVGVASGEDFATSGRAQVLVVGNFPDGKARTLSFHAVPEIFVDGQKSPYDWQSVFAFLLDMEPGKAPMITGILTDGSIQFDKASMKPGEKVSGTFSASLLKWNL